MVWTTNLRPAEFRLSSGWVPDQHRSSLDGEREQPGRMPKTVPFASISLPYPNNGISASTNPRKTCVNDVLVDAENSRLH